MFFIRDAKMAVKRWHIVLETNSIKMSITRKTVMVLIRHAAIIFAGIASSKADKTEARLPNQIEKCKFVCLDNICPYAVCLNIKVMCR